MAAPTMQTAKQTLALNGAIYGSLVALLFVHGAFFGLWVKSLHADIKTQGEKLRKFQQDLAGEREKTDLEKERVRQAVEEVDRRATELAGYGNFLPHVNQKSETLSKLLGIIEELGIKIVTQDFNRPPEPAPEGAGYLTYSFTLELTGDHRSFKRMLHRLQMMDTVIRVVEFAHNDTGQVKPYLWKVAVRFQTYFTTIGG